MWIGMMSWNIAKLGITEKKARLAFAEDIRKENAPEFDYSAFYGRLVLEDRLLCYVKFSLAPDEDSQSRPRGDFAPYRTLFSVSCANPHKRIRKTLDGYNPTTCRRLHRRFYRNRPDPTTSTARTRRA